MLEYFYVENSLEVVDKRERVNKIYGVRSLSERGEKGERDNDVGEEGSKAHTFSIFIFKNVTLLYKEEHTVLAEAWKFHH